MIKFFISNKKSLQARQIYVVILTTLILVSFTGCSTSSPSIMEPKGPAAGSISTLGWIFFILGGLVFLGVMAYLIYALVRPRPEIDPTVVGTRIVIYAGMVVPGIILLVLFVLNTNVLGQVSAPPEAASLKIDVTGNQWWWEVSYPDYQFETANEIYIPVNQPVKLRLHSQDVIHSFWVPELHGKMDLIPGRVNDFWIQADEAGTFLGECAEYCGTQHAKMQFRVIAVEENAFNEWINQMQQTAQTPAQDSPRDGLEVFLSSNCIQCHTVRGTTATGALGPDLTHLSSRSTIGAGSLPFSRANLSGWVADPHSIKPGVKMPATNLGGAEFNALLDYLMTLR